MPGTVITWQNSGSGNYTNVTDRYVGKTDNGYYLVKFTWNAQTRIVAVKSYVEIPSEILKIISGTAAYEDAVLLSNQVKTLITNAPSDIYLEDLLDTSN
jgi:hypothetical protein